MFSRAKLRAPLVLLLITILFHWRILFTSEFSLLTGYESVNQVYSWYTFWIRTIRHGLYPLWDPYTFAGHPFAGEMQTGIFDPFNFLLALFPLNAKGLFSPVVYHAAYTLTRFAGAYFMYLLAREFGIREFGALIAGICFTLGGSISHYEGWPHLLQSGICLPLIFLFLLRALRSDAKANAARYAMLSGLCLGLSILAGGLHLVIMQVIVVVSAAAFNAFHADRAGRTRAALIVAIVAGIGLAAGAVQLFPSFEYSRVAYRSLGNTMLPATRRIPYAFLADKLLAVGPLELVFPQGFGGVWGIGEFTNPYIGVFPLLLAGIGVWRCWRNPWVRYLAFLGLGAYVYALGDFSFLHGVLYALVPDLWMAREAPRFLYLADFGLVLFAGFGAQALFDTADDTAGAGENAGFDKLTRALNWIVLACGALLLIPVIFGKPEISPWVGFSLFLIVCSWALYRFIVAGHCGLAPRVLVIFLILFDLYGWDWGPRNRIVQAASPAGDEMEKLHSLSGAVAFLHSRPGPFRVHIDGNVHPNLGDAYAIEATHGGGATLLQSFAHIIPRLDLLNVRYILRPASVADSGAVYQDASWKVYENRNAFPRAWIVHRLEKAGSEEDIQRRFTAPGFDAHTTAILQNLPANPLQPAAANAQEAADVRETALDRLDIHTRAGSAAMLVLSEIYYPGWIATVNGRPAPIAQVDGALRGIVIPPGDSTVVFQYRPASVYWGAGLSIAALFGVLWVQIRSRHAQALPERDPATCAAAEA